jgi:hypothetical protein
MLQLKEQLRANRLKGKMGSQMPECFTECKAALHQGKV